jgi:hypothetical protein
MASSILQIRVPVELYLQLKRAAAIKRVTVSQFVRTAVERAAGATFASLPPVTAQVTTPAPIMPPHDTRPPQQIAASQVTSMVTARDDDMPDDPDYDEDEEKYGPCP